MLRESQAAQRTMVSLSQRRSITTEEKQRATLYIEEDSEIPAP